jgi:MoaA/NifB/PqqE/SkfB family radical SAM enzyme
VGTTRRVKIVTGLKCNIQCVFCYYRDNLNAPNRTIEAIRKDIGYAFSHGVREVDFSGGEPTVHKQLPELISYAKSIGMERCCIISNGVRLADASYLCALKESGLDEILFSLHGPDAQTHDEITQHRGSFDKISRALDNAVKLGLDIRINTVVNRLNYRKIDSLSVMLLELSPVQVNFITINDWCFAKHLVDKYMLSYTEMSGFLKEACDILEPVVPAVNIRYIPFCFMRGYERFICDHRQVAHDPYEWMPHVRARLEEGTGLLRYTGILGYGFAMAGAYRGVFKKPWKKVLDDCVVEGLRRWFYTKPDSCRDCAFQEICDGVERTYSGKYGVEELVPCKGEKIVDPVHFRRGNRFWSREK